MFNSIKSEIKKCNYVFFCNANTLFVKKVSKEILPDSSDSGLVAATSNPLVFARDRSVWTYERNPESLAYVPFGSEGPFYYRGCFNGGSSKAFIKMSEELDCRIQQDLSRGVIALWHDESHLNKYFSELSPHPKMLDPGYAYGEQWPCRNLIEPVILMRDKTKLYGSLELLRGVEDDRYSRRTLYPRFFRRIISLIKKLYLQSEIRNSK